jgi:hypothetical protein
MLSMDKEPDFKSDFMEARRLLDAAAFSSAFKRCSSVKRGGKAIGQTY